MSKIVGIIGGVGPYAGVDFHQKILESTPVAKDQDHLEIYHLCASAKIGDRSAYLQDRSLANPAEGLIYVAQKLLSIGAQILVIPCNTAHSQPILAPFLQSLAGQEVQFLHLVEETCAHLRSLQLEKVGLLSTLGTYDSGVYEDAFAKFGCGELLCPSQAKKQMISSAIYDSTRGIKSGADILWSKQLLTQVVRSLQRKGAQAIIMGCTEIPLALSQQDFDVPLLDPGLILARRIVQEAL